MNLSKMKVKIELKSWFKKLLVVSYVVHPKLFSITYNKLANKGLLIKLV